MEDELRACYLLPENGIDVIGDPPQSMDVIHYFTRQHWTQVAFWSWAQTQTQA